MAIAPPDNSSWPALQKFRKAVAVVDIVESVLLMQQHEDDVIDRWRRFVDEIRRQLLPHHAGRMVKSLGDGMLLEFASAPTAVAAAIEIQRRIRTVNAGYAPSACLLLRIGIHVSNVVTDADDIYGAGVNLAARLTSLAGPEEIVISSDARDELVAGLDADVEDLGDVHLKHIDSPVRAFRVGRAGARPLLPSASESLRADLRPVVAIVPFDYIGNSASSDIHCVGELIADGVISQVSVSRSLRVVSRMSSSAFRGRQQDSGNVAKHLGASYILSGSYHSAGRKLVIHAEIADARKREVVWAERLTGDMEDLLQAESEILHTLAAALSREILAAEVAATRQQALPTLESYSLQIGGVSLMHRSGKGDFDRAREVLEHLIARHPRLAAPRAWLAKWYVLRVTRGIVRDIASEAGIALEHTRRALDADPGCSLALAMHGFVKCHLLSDLKGALVTFEEAIDLNSSDSLAWLFKGVVYSFWGEGDRALAATTEAQRLSPLDPLQYYYDSLTASAALSAKKYELAIELAERSLRVNRSHSPTLRTMAIAQSELGQDESAMRTVQQLLSLEPGLTVKSYIDRSPAGANPTRVAYAEALRRAGIPLK